MRWFWAEKCYYYYFINFITCRGNIYHETKSKLHSFSD